MPVLNTKLTSHKEVYHYTAAPRALVTLATLSLSGSPDQTFCKDAVTQSKPRLIFANEVTSLQKWLSQDKIWPISGQTSYYNMTKGKTSKTGSHINPLWLIPTRTKEYVLCSAWWLIHFSRLLSFVLSLSFSIFLPLSVSQSTFLGKHFMPEQSASAYLHPYPIALLLAWGPQALNFSGERHTKAYLGSHWCTWGPMCRWLHT